MDDTRKWFEYFFNSKEMRDSSGAIKQEWIDFIGSGKAYEIWQACQSLNDKRIQQLLAVIELQREALRKICRDANSRAYAEQIADEALSIKPKNVELVEVGYIGTESMEVFLTMGMQISPESCDEPVDTLYTIKTKA